MEKFRCVGGHCGREVDPHARMEGQARESFWMDCLSTRAREEGRIFPSHHPLRSRLKFYAGMRGFCKPQRKTEKKCASE